MMNDRHEGAQKASSDMTGSDDAPAPNAPSFGEAVRSASFVLYFYVLTTLFALVCAPYALLARDAEPARRIARLWERAVHRGLRWIVGLELAVEGLERLPERPCIIASKHQSALETISFHMILPKIAIALKVELIRIPVFGAYLRKVGAITIDRGGAAKALRSLVSGAETALARGDHVMIYPEGTRRPLGAPPDYKPGVAALYKRLGAPVTPVALDTGLYWRKGFFGKRAGVARIVFLEPIEPGLDRKTFEARLIDAIETHSDHLAANPVGPSASGGR